MVVKLLGVVLLIAGFALANGNIEDPPVECLTLSRGNFDALDRDFIFGTASASYQFEGAAFEDGRTPSIWDHYAHNHSERIRDHKNADVTVDQYHRYKEDVQIMKNLNTDAYRLSISWSRVLPTGKLSGGVNRLGIQYYNNLIDELIKNGITPYVTIFHWDLPQSLEEEFGGFLSPRIIGHFRDFAEVLFMNFGDRVKHWITLNEPFTFTHNGYAVGTFAPGRCSRWQTAQNCLGGDSGTEPYVVTHHLLLCHAAAVQLYKTKYQVNQKGVIGITLVTIWPEPISDAQEDKDAANRFLDFMYGWYMDPIVYGDYPYSMRSTVGQRLPYFTEEESQLLKGSYDFIGVNYYSARYASNMAPSEHPSYTTDHNVNLTTMRDGVLIGPMNGSDWICAYPKGFENILLYTKEKYNDPLIYITENGISDIDDPNSPLKLPGALDDVNRVDYYQRHLCHLLTAMKKGVKVKGYFAWSLLDNYEWECGYTHRFGIIYVDYKNGLTRHYTSSAKWFRKFLSRSGPPGKIGCECHVVWRPFESHIMNGIPS